MTTPGVRIYVEKGGWRQERGAFGRFDGVDLVIDVVACQPKVRRGPIAQQSSNARHGIVTINSRPTSSIATPTNVHRGAPAYASSVQSDASCLKLRSPSEHPHDSPQAQIGLVVAFDGFNDRLD